MRDETMPEGPWEFDKGVTEVFEDMLERSIPDYEKMRNASSALAFASGPVDRVLDIGCSNGLALRRLDKYAEVEGHKINRLIGLDVSEPMLEKAAEDYQDQLRIGKVDVDQNQQLAMQYQVRAIPTLLLFKGGQVVSQHTGALNRGQLDSFVSSAL